ncbi:MAG TPA: class I SAM-dependent methyltransferase [Mesorhizobium sp.]|nr:class I SAM-dependent methyltransferase [Mesorhizobium sp.]
MDQHFAANRLNWDDRAEIHATDRTGLYAIEAVLNGGSSLGSIEAGDLATLIGLAGKDVAHLQCHIGLDTLSLKHGGASSVVGLDFSPRAVAAARDFAQRAGTEARFVEASVYDAEAALGRERFDLVYVTWGAINWLPDLERWAKIVAALLKPGGRLYLLEGHPQMNQFESRDGRPELLFDWRTPGDRPLVFDDAQTYTGDERTLAHTRVYEWIHPLSEVVGAVLGAGLSLDFLHEHERLVWRAFPGMIEVSDREYALPTDWTKFPLAFSLGATKPT